MSAFSAAMNMREEIIVIADLFAAGRGIGRKRLSTIVFNRGSKLDDIAEGADLGTGTFEKAMEYFAGNWPEGAVWPEGIARPDSPSLTPAASAPQERGGVPDCFVPPLSGKPLAGPLARPAQPDQSEEDAA